MSMKDLEMVFLIFFAVLHVFFSTLEPTFRIWVGNAGSQCFGDAQPSQLSLPELAEGPYFILANLGTSQVAKVKTHLIRSGPSLSGESL